MRWHFIPDFDGDVSPVFDRRASRQEARPNRELSLSVSQGRNPSRRRLQRAWIVTAMDRVRLMLCIDAGRAPAVPMLYLWRHTAPHCLAISIG